MPESISTLKKVIDIFKMNEDVVVAKHDHPIMEQKVVQQLTNMTVQDLMEKRFIILSPSATVKDVIKLFLEKSTTELVVIDGGKLVGIVSDRDILRLFEEVNLTCQKTGDLDECNRKMKTIGNVQVSKIIKHKTYVFQNSGLFDAIIKMDENNITVLPIVDEGGYIIGILREKNIIQSFLNFLS